jgi:hypothetical protein
MRVSVELEHRRDGPLEKGTVVAHDRDTAGDATQEALEAIEPVEVEVVRRLVEEQHVERAQQDRPQSCARSLATRECHGLPVEELGGKVELGAHGGGARRKIRTTHGEVPLQRRRVRVAGARLAGRERVRSAFELGLGGSDASTLGEEPEQCLAAPTLGFLR